MKIKLFVKDKGLQRWRRFVGELEDEVNAWLAANSNVKVVHVTQSSNGGSFDTSKLFISVWYEESTSQAIRVEPSRAPS